MAAPFIEVTGSPPEQELDTLCAVLGVRLREQFASRYGLVARVTDGDGRDLLLKTRQQARHDCMDEADALLHWSGCDAVPRLRLMRDDGTHLRDFIEGQALTEQPDRGAAHLETVAAAAARLHHWGSPPTGHAHAWFVNEMVQVLDHCRLSATEAERFRRLGRRLADCGDEVLIHGDLFHRNVVVTAAGPCFIDPLARLGLPAFDLVSLALTTPGHSPEEHSDRLLRGYGERPQLFDEVLRWALLRNRHYHATVRAAGGEWEPCFIAGPEGEGARWTE